MDRSMCSAVYFVAFPLAYGLSVLAGRATRLAGSEVALVWPAAAVAIVWVLATWRCSPRQRAAHLGLLAAVTFVMNLMTGAPPQLSAWFVLVNVVLAVVTVGVLAHGRTDVALRDPADLARLIVAVAAGVCTASALATAYLAPLSNVSVGLTFTLFAVRNGAWALLGVALWLRVKEVTWTRPRLSPAAVTEALLAGTGIVALLTWTFWQNTGVPLAFLILVPAAWVALRYSTTVSTVFLVLSGAWITFATLQSRGALIVPDPQQRALLAQAMVCSLTVIVLALALYRDSRTRLIRQLKTARDEAARDTELLEAVLDSIHDGVVLVGSAGEVVLQNSQAADSGVVGEIIASSVDVDKDRSLPRDVVVGARDNRVIELTTAPLARQPDLTVAAFRDVTGERRNAQALREARDLFAGVLQAASEQAIIGTDPAGRITVFNNGAERLAGWTYVDVIGRELVDLHDRSEILRRAADLGVPAGFQALVHNVGPEQAEVREWTYVRLDGTRVAVNVAVSQMTAEDGSCAGYICVATDITEQKAAEQALAESEERFRLAFDTAPMGMLMFDVGRNSDGRVTRCNRAMADLLGRSEIDVLGTTISELGRVVGDSAANGLGQLLELEAGQRFDAETAFRRADGGMMWGAVSASVVAPPGSRPYGICLVEDITTRKRVEAELQHLALHDMLTGLANRALLLDRIERALAGAKRDDQSVLGLIFLDLDGFKAVNDTWGHAEGDEVLKEVARRIQACIRTSDTAARLGGDEFAVLCPGLSDIARVQIVAERIRGEVSRPVELAGGGTYDQLSVSAGVVMSQPGNTAEVLLQRADRLMYQAKRGGSSGVVADDPFDPSVVLRPAALLAEMGRALDLDELVVHFQPIVDLRTGEPVAAEALLRWQHPRWGLLAPVDFLTAVESSHHMPALGRRVLDLACRHAAQWFGPAAAAAVHVNISGRQLEVGHFYTDVRDALETSGLDPNRLVLELTETHAGRVENSAKADLERLRQLGVRIAIDDVGTGFSGLVKILDLPIDMLKIDQQFISGLPDDPRCEAIVKAMLSLGSSLGLAIVAEGIERPEQRDVLVQWGCALGQGFLLGDVSPPADDIPSPAPTPI